MLIYGDYKDCLQCPKMQHILVMLAKNAIGDCHEYIFPQMQILAVISTLEQAVLHRITFGYPVQHKAS